MFKSTNSLKENIVSAPTFAVAIPSLADLARLGHHFSTEFSRSLADLSSNFSCCSTQSNHKLSSLSSKPRC